MGESKDYLSLHTVICCVCAAFGTSFLLASERPGGYDVGMEMIAYFASPQQWFILAIVCLVVFGASRLPDLARNLGKSIGILKKAKRDFEEELLKAQTPEQPAATALPDEQKAQQEAAVAQQGEDTAAPRSPQA